jgi:hypothetical protein
VLGLTEIKPGDIVACSRGWRGQVAGVKEDGFTVGVDREWTGDIVWIHSSSLELDIYAGTSMSRSSGNPIDEMRYTAGRVGGMRLAVAFLLEEIAKFEYGSSQEGWPVFNLENVLDRLNDEIEEVVG